MLSKFSVKKPYTIIVGIVLIIVLGVVAYTKMTTDLLPSIELPYAIVVTTYVGASPEEVEETVTKPVEQAMATINNIKNVSSTSSENYSMVVLEFNSDTNMDSVTIDMRESLDQISGYWSDSVGSPIIMKINPDMMPVMVSAVDVDGMDSVELTKYINNQLSPSIEALDGVASVTSIGTIEESVNVIIREEKIEEINKQIKDSLDDTFKEAEDAMEDAKVQISSGKTQLDNQRSTIQSQLSSAQLQLSDKKLELLQGEIALKEALEELLAKEKDLQTSEKELKANEEKINTTLTSLTEMNNQLLALYAQKADLEGKIALNDDGSLDAALATVNGYILALESGLSGQTDENGEPISAERLPEIISKLQESLVVINSSKEALAEGSLAIEQGKIEIDNKLKEITNGKVTINDAMAEINEKSNKAEAGFNEAQIELTNGENTLNEQMESFDDTKNSAYENSDMSSIITSDMVKGILTAQNFSMPAGYVTEEGIDYLVRVGNKFEDVEDMSDFVLMDLGIDGVNPIKLKDVAEVAIVNDSESIYTKINGNPGVMLSIQKQTNFATAEVADTINKKFDELMKKDSTLHITSLMDQGVYIKLIVNSVLQNLVFGAILAVIILFLFLKDIKPTFIIACSIPVSVIFAIVLMYFSGVTLNVISLSGLALGVGMLVDNSIVVIENIFRLRKEGVSAKEAAIEGAKEVSGAILASTLTTVSVFLPIVFTSGITKQLFVDMALTIGYSLGASLIIALTFVPMMASKMLGKSNEKKNILFDKLQEQYGKLLKIVLKHKTIVFIFSITALIVSGLVAVNKGYSLMPSMDSTQLSITITMPEGTVDINETAKVSDAVIDVISEIEDVETVGAMVGGSSLSMMGLGGDDSVDTVTMYVLCKEDKKLTNNEIANIIREETIDLPCEINISESTMDLSALSASGVVIDIKGKDNDTLREIATEVAGIIENVDGIEEVSDGQEKLTNELRIEVDKDKAAEYGLTVAQVYQAVAAKINTATTATTLNTDTNEYSVVVKEDKSEEITLNDIRNMTIQGTENKETIDIKIGNIATISDGLGFASISRDNQSRYVSVTGKVNENYSTSKVSKKVEKALSNYKLPDGYSIEYSGETQSVYDAMEQVLLMLILAIVFMYLIMVAQFQSLLSPFIIMFTIPLAFTGGFIGLIIAGMDVSVIALIGYVMLSGVIVNNGIVLVDAINQLIESGIPKEEAIIIAGKRRLRPIIMTALTTILGLSTMAAGMGMGSDMVQPMAVVTIGGLVYGTLLTLLVVPCIYDAFMKKKVTKINENQEAIQENIKVIQ